MAKASDVKRTSSGLEYRDKTYPGFNKPKTNPDSDKHKKVVLAKKGDEVKVFKFGHRDYGNNYSEEARKNYLARSVGIKDGSGNHTKNDKFSPNYWSRKVLWGGPNASKSMPKSKSPGK